MKLSSVTLRLSFQDLSMKNLLSQRYQYGNVSFTYAPDAKSMNMSLGTLYRLNASDSASAYPYFEVSQPLVETRLFSMRLLFGLDTYLPVYPQVDFTGIYNASGPAMFPNYNIVGGFSFNSWQITAKLLASHHKGESYPLVNSEFTTNQVDTSYDSSMDVTASLEWEGKAVSAHLMYEQPLDFDGGLTIHAQRGHFQRGGLPRGRIRNFHGNFLSEAGIRHLRHCRDCGNGVLRRELRGAVWHHHLHVR